MAWKHIDFLPLNDALMHEVVVQSSRRLGSFGNPILDPFGVHLFLIGHKIEGTENLMGFAAFGGVLGIGQDHSKNRDVLARHAL